MLPPKLATGSAKKNRLKKTKNPKKIQDIQPTQSGEFRIEFVGGVSKAKIKVPGKKENYFQTRT